MAKRDIIDELWEDIKFNRKKFILAILTISLFVLGHSIAPSPLPDGEYTMNLKYYASVTLETSFEIRIDSSTDFPLNNIVYNVTSGDLIVIIDYWEVYPGIIGERIHFDVSAFRGISPLENINSDLFSVTLNNGKELVEFTSSSTDGAISHFEIRILKNSKIGLGLLFAISFLWLTELIPLAASSLIIPVVIVLSGIDGATGAFSNFANPIIFLFLSGFLMAEAMHRSELDKYISLRIISFVPPKPKVLMLTFMVLTAVFSMFMSNTAAVAILIPIALTLLESANIKDEKYKKAMVLSIAYSATVGGIGTMIGTAPNIIAVEFIKEYNPALEINFLEWMLFGLPVVMIMIPIIFFYLWSVFRPNVDQEDLRLAKEKGLDEVKRHKHMTLDQIIVALIFVFIISMWLTTSLHGISASVVAVMGAVLFFFTGQLTKNDFQNIGWGTLITFGGGLSLGYVIIETGLADYIAGQLASLGDLHLVLTTTIVALIALTMTAIASNTASAAILIPIAMPLAIVLGINPILLAVLVAIACSVDFAMVIGTPPTMLAYDTGFFEVKEIFRIGIILDLIGIVVVLVMTWTLFGLFVVLVS